VIFVFVRIKRNRMLNTEWTWIPDEGAPFYRMSEMKVLNKDHAPKDATGLCLEVTLADNDPKLKEPENYWKKLANDFLGRVFSLQEREIIGMDVVTREFAYPDFTVRNTELIARCIEEPYRTGQTEHRFRTGIENLALAGRAGTFVYLLTPWAIMSGQKAAKQAIAYASGRAKASVAS
jgi:protoporphyrinogen oxidase